MSNVKWYNLFLPLGTYSDVIAGIPVYSGVGGGVVDGCELGDVSRRLVRKKVPGEMESSSNLKFRSVCLARCPSLPTFLHH